MTRLLALCGSLRATSSNKSALLAANVLAPPGVTIDLSVDLGRLPHFNPDVEMAALPPEVADLRALVGEADGLLVSSPEYAHGIPGVMKNGLDWLVGSLTFPGKPVGILNTTFPSRHAHAALLEVIATMSGVIVADAVIDLPLRGRPPGPAPIIADPFLAPRLQAGLLALVLAAGKLRGRAFE